MKNYLSFIIIALIYTSCFEDPIELDLNQDNTKLVVEAWISDLNKPQYIKLSYTANYIGSDSYLYEDNAEVTLSDQSGHSYSLQPQGEGKYFLPADWITVYGDTYELICTVDGISYQAKHLLRQSPEIEELYIDPIFNDQDSLMGFESVFSFQEIPGLGDAYYVVDYERGTTNGDTLLNGGYADDEFFDGEYIEDIRVTEEDYLYEQGDTIIVELYSLGEETAQFLLDVELEVFRGGPFDPPPANVRTNFSGGAIGYFIMSGADQQMIVVK